MVCIWVLFLEIKRSKVLWEKNIPKVLLDFLLVEWCHTRSASRLLYACASSFVSGLADFKQSTVYGCQKKLQWNNSVGIPRIVTQYEVLFFMNTNRTRDPLFIGARNTLFESSCRCFLNVEKGKIAGVVFVIILD